MEEKEPVNKEPETGAAPQEPTPLASSPAVEPAADPVAEPAAAASQPPEAAPLPVEPAAQPVEPVAQPVEQPAPAEKALIYIRPDAEARTGGEPAQDPPQAKANGFWDRPGWLALILVGLVSSCMAVFLTLAILGVANRGLSYASPSDVSALQTQVDTLRARVDSAAEDLSGLRARVVELEELAARTTELERMALELQEEIDLRVAQAEELRGSVVDMQDRIAEVVTQSKAFQSFVDGLRDLLDIFPGGPTP